MNKPLKVYLAGPFFNEDQRKVIDQLEKTLEPYCELYSPRRDGGVLGPKASKDQRAKIFELNYEKIKSCDIMIAQVEGLDDRPYQIVQKLLRSFNRKIASGPVQTDALIGVGVLAEFAGILEKEFTNQSPNYIDIGTVWEMGAAYECGVPVLAFSPNINRQMNVMLTESCRGFVSKYEDIIPAIENIINGGQAGHHEGDVQ
jgi:nucleoside 2-deoxyribosyltransferase